MGLEIGFTAYRKTGYAGNWKLEKIDNQIHDNDYMCGRTDLNYAWGRFFHDSCEITFDEDLKDYPIYESDDGYVTKLDYVSWDEFKKYMMRSIEEAKEQEKEDRKGLENTLEVYEEKRKEILRMQLTATCESEYKNAERMVAELDDTIAEIKRDLSDERYFATGADAMKAMLELMETLMDYDLTVIAYWSD